MKTTFLREELLAKLKTAIQFVPKKAVLPAHESFLFKIEAGKLSITALDGEKQITTQCNTSDSDGDIMFCIHAKVLVNTLSLMLDESVSFAKKSLKNDMAGKCTIEIKSGKSKYRMQCDDGEDYPLMPHIKSDYEASFTGSSFNTAMEVVSQYASVENSITSMGYICLRADGNSINAYGCSNHDLSKVSVSPRSINSWGDILIPANTIKAVVKCINDMDIVDITHNKDKVEIRTEELSIISLAANMKYPDVEEFYKKKPENKIKMNTIEFLQALQRVNLFAEEENPIIRIDIQTSQLVINVNNNLYARDGDETIDIVAEKELSFGCNVLLLIKALKLFTNDEFEMFYSEPNRLIFIDPIDVVRDNNKFFALMPSTLN